MSCFACPAVLTWTHVCRRADADLQLLGSRQLPKSAFAGKVVWITGASQVSGLLLDPCTGFCGILPGAAAL